MKTIYMRLENGKLTRIEPDPAHLAKLREQVAKQFSNDGRDLLFERIVAGLKLRAKKP